MGFKKVWSWLEPIIDWVDDLIELLALLALDD